MTHATLIHPDHVSPCIHCGSTKWAVHFGSASLVCNGCGSKIGPPASIDVSDSRDDLLKTIPKAEQRLSDVILECDRLGITFTIHGDRLRCYPADAIDDALLAGMRSTRKAMTKASHYGELARSIKKGNRRDCVGHDGTGRCGCRGRR